MAQKWQQPTMWNEKQCKREAEKKPDKHMLK